MLEMILKTWLADGRYGASEVFECYLIDGSISTWMLFGTSDGEKWSW
jgi:hypothetical protein